MMIAARNAFLMSGGASTPTARDYVQDGLVAMWDGIENAGWGVHDAAATVWKDLSGSGYDFRNLNAVDHWSSDSAVFAGVPNLNYETWNIANILTLEVVGKSAATSYFGFSLCSANKKALRMFAILPSGNRGFQFSSSAPSMYRDWTSRWAVSATWENGYVQNQNAQYYNGVFANSNTGTSSWSVENNTAVLGRPNPDPYVYIGEICSIRAYSRALTAAEVAANYAVDAARFGL